MAITGVQVINVGLPNESTGSDSLYTAFNKINTNFATLFGNSSPYNTFTGTGVSITANSTSGIVNITNTGVTSLTAGTGITINQSTGNIVISSIGGGGGGNGTVTSVGLVALSASRLSVTGSPIVSSGNISIDMVVTGVTAGTYVYPTMTVDAYGRVLSIANANSVGTVTSVGIIPGTGIQVSNSPVTTSGAITVTNTGVTRLSAGTGIALSGSNGNVTISATGGSSGSVLSVGLSSNTLTVTNTPVTSVGVINVEIPNYIGGNITFTGNLLVSSNKLKISGGTNGYYLQTDGAGNVTWATGTAVLTGTGTSSGANTLIQISDGAGDFTSAAGFSFDSDSNVFSIPGNLTSSGSMLLTGTEVLTNGSTVDLSVPVSYFSTSGVNIVSILPAGTNGLIKTFIMTSFNGVMTVNVTNPGWKTDTTGYMTFNSTGMACTLQYINNKWYCIGNNNVNFT